MRKSYRGLNVIELVVVIAVVGVLAAVIMPVLVSAKENIHHNPCISNLKDIRKALTLYREDYSGRYPSAPVTSGFNVVGLVGTLAPYTKDMGMWMCPYGARRKLNAVYCEYPPNGDKMLVGWIRLPDGTNVSTNYYSIPLSRTRYQDPEYCRGLTPDEAIELWGNIFSPDGIFGYMGTPEFNGRLIQDAYGLAPLWWPHDGGYNMLYHDGHVRWAKDPRS